jgi:hypothetical protein
MAMLPGDTFAHGRLTKLRTPTNRGVSDDTPRETPEKKQSRI